MAQHVDPVVAPAALGRAVLLGRAAAVLTATAVGSRLVDDPRPLLAVVAVVLLTTVAGLVALSRNPYIVSHPVPVVILDAIVVVGVLALSGGGVAYFCAAVGASALAGVLLGMRALVVAGAHTALGYVVAAGILRHPGGAELAGFVLTFPIADVLAAVGAAVATAALGRYVQLSVEVVEAAQRTAAAAERARLARELHDSVAKTLRGVSFAALALPSSLRRHPDLAEQLAGTVSRGAEAAAREARELVDGLRLDPVESDFAETVSDICLGWSRATGVAVRLATTPSDPPVAVRYELSRILQEALHNVARHADATSITVSLRAGRDHLRMRIHDDGRGFPMPSDIAELRAAHRFGLIGMYERAATVSGTLHVQSAPGRGTTVDVVVPA